MLEDDIWTHEAAYGRDAGAIARADLLVVTWQEVRVDDFQLTLVRDDDPPKHVTVTGWSEHLETRKRFAQELCSRLREGDTKLRP